MSYKIVCTGNPNKNTIAKAVKAKWPASDFLHLSNGYDLRLWDDKRKHIFTNKIKDYDVFINASHISHMAQYDLLNAVESAWTTGLIINIGSTAEHDPSFGNYHVEKNALKIRSLQIKGDVKSTHITVPGLNDLEPGHEDWMPLDHVADIIHSVLESPYHIQLIQAI
jgi:NADP-dependent 3-hydroxy acid dehydrogenase YdfG|tara:strand:- start:1431 stop:1931 length:501 start_codon:yes stop_codon:yes gene_type:complete